MRFALIQIEKGISGRRLAAALKRGPRPNRWEVAP